MAKIKLCGLTGIRDALYANEAMPDYVGFVFEKGRHFVSDRTAADMRRVLNPLIPAAGVFVRENPDHIRALTEKGIIQIVQLHGGETEDYIHKVRSMTGCPVIRAVSVSSSGDISSAQETEADFLLLDHGRGGTGIAFDWSLIPPIRKPWFMAGGIGKGNVRQALSYGPYGVDISSGAETEGRKDLLKMKDLVRMVRQESEGL